METDSLSYKTIKNVGYSFIGMLFPIVFSVFITPVVVHRLGIVTYGIFILVNTILGFLGLLDLGLNNALIKYISEFESTGRKEELQEFLSSANTIYFIIGLVGLLIFVILGFFFLPLFHITGTSQQSILIVFFLGGLVFFINSANNVYTSIPVALQRFDLVTKLNLSQLAFLNLATLALVLTGFQLKAIFLVNIFSLAVITIFYYFYSRRLLGRIPLKFGWHQPAIKKMYSFGLLSAISNITLTSLNQLDRLVIPIFLGPAALSYYSLPGNVAQKTTTIVGSLGGVFFPLSSSLQSQGLLGQLGSIYRKIIRNITVLAAGVTTAIIVFGYKILFYWLGKDFADKGAPVLTVLAVTYFILSIYGNTYNFLLGMGKVKFLAWWSTALAAINIGLMFILIPRYGILGAAWAFLGASVPVVVIFYWLEKKYFNLTNISRFYLVLCGKILLVSVLFFLLAKLLILNTVKSLTALIIIGPLSVILYFLIYYICGFFDKEDTVLFKAFFLKMIAKFR